MRQSRYVSRMARSGHRRTMTVVIAKSLYSDAGGCVDPFDERADGKILGMALGLPAVTDTGI